jgi:pimeloyl-ACP methyl ester carboxylesterase
VVRNPKTNPVLQAVMRVVLAAPFIATTWKAYLPSLFAGRKPADFTEYVASVIAAMRRPGYAKAFSLTTRTTHDPAQARLGNVHTPTLVIMGELDPDFPKPADEAAWVAEQLDATVLMVPESGHYPHAQQPELVNPAVVDFLGTLARA